MRPDDFFRDDLVTGERALDLDLIERLHTGTLSNARDIDAAYALNRLVHDEFELYGTDNSQQLTNEQSSIALRALRAVVVRVGINGFDPEFRDFKTFRTHWNRNDGYGSWQARRDLLEDVFGPLHEQLTHMQNASYTATLSTAISSHERTGWGPVDTEISELRRHFATARTPQDYAAIGHGCVRLTEALSREVYDHAKHRDSAEEIESAVDQTKKRFDRFIASELSGDEHEHVRKLARATIELAQSVKHRSMPTRREAGIAADAVIQLANMFRRLREPE